MQMHNKSGSNLESYKYFNILVYQVSRTHVPLNCMGRKSINNLT